MICVFFFFSSRRRHTRYWRDWSSDVCSSDLVVTEELQRTFPGCYSVMHDIKQQQQRGEHLLDQAERIVEGFAEEDEKPELHARLEGAWDDLLFTEFHDILAGTSVPAAWDSVRAMQGRARITGEEVAVEVTRRWARRALPPIDEQQIVVLNPDEARSEERRVGKECRSRWSP